MEREEPIVLRSKDARGLVTLRLNRPQAFNALSEAMLETLQREFDAIAADESVRVVVLAAEGKAFCAGHDLKEMRATPSLNYYQRLFAQCSKVMLAVQRLPVPVVARVHGVATAAGCQLVAMCDLAVASRELIPELAFALLVDCLLALQSGPFINPTRSKSSGESHPRERPPPH